MRVSLMPKAKPPNDGVDAAACNYITRKFVANKPAGRLASKDLFGAGYDQTGLTL